MTAYNATTDQNECLFCAIIAGHISTPGRFWENDEFAAWLAIDPNTPGFTVVVPKSHQPSDVLALPDDLLQRFVIAAKQVSQILLQHYPDCGRVGLIMEGTGINHAHIKLVPMHGTPFLKDGQWQQVLSEGEVWSENYTGFITSAGGPMADSDDLATLAAKLSAISESGQAV